MTQRVGYALGYRKKLCRMTRSSHTALSQSARVLHRAAGQVRLLLVGVREPYRQPLLALAEDLAEEPDLNLALEQARQLCWTVVVLQCGSGDLPALSFCRDAAKSDFVSLICLLEPQSLDMTESKVSADDVCRPDAYEIIRGLARTQRKRLANAAREIIRPFAAANDLPEQIRKVDCGGGQ